MRQEDVRALVRYDPGNGKFYRADDGKELGHSDSGYVWLSIGNSVFLSHRLAWFYEFGVWPGELDHINENKSDNRILNLREISRSGNCQNRSGVRGFYGQGRKWFSSIMVNGKPKYLGTFDTPEEAREAYFLAKKTVHPWWSGIRKPGHMQTMYLGMEVI